MRKLITFLLVFSFLTLNTYAMFDTFARGDDCPKMDCEKVEGEWPETCVFCYCEPEAKFFGGNSGFNLYGGDEIWCRNYDCAELERTAGAPGECWKEGWRHGARCDGDEEQGDIYIECYYYNYCCDNGGSDK